MCMYVYVYVCMYVCVYVCMYVLCMYVCIYIYVYTYVILNNSIVFSMTHPSCYIYRVIPPDDEQ